MPAAIPFIIQAVGYYLGVNALVVAAVTLVATAAISSAQKRKAQRQARDAYNASLEDRTIMTATANTPRAVLYGRVRNTDGVIFKGTFGSKKEWYALAVALCHGESDGIETVYFGDVPVNLQADGVVVAGGAGTGYNVNSAPYVKDVLRSASATAVVTAGTGSVVLPHTPVAGSVSATVTLSNGEGSFGGTVNVVGNTVTVTGANDGTYVVAYQWVETLFYAKVWKYLGAPGQDVSKLLKPWFPDMILDTDKGQGITMLVVLLTYDQDVYPTGVPSISAIVRGRKINDPRTGTTAWSQNPALIARDWALYQYGGGAAADEIVDSAFIAAANPCDVPTTFNLSTGGSETRPLYQCGTVCKLDVQPDDHFDQMVTSMAGKWGWSGGRLTVVAGVYRAPVLALDDTALTSEEDVLVVKDPPQTDVVNVYRPVIANADGYTGTLNGEGTSVAYTSTPMPEIRSAAYIAADGRELPRDIALLGVTRNVHCQHICGVLMRDQRDGLIARIPCNNRAFILELFDVVTLTLAHFGFVAKQFEVIGWSYEFDKGVMLTLKETSALIFSVNTGLNDIDLADNSALPIPWAVPQVTNVQVTSGTPALQDGWPQTRTKVTWNSVNDEAVRQAGKIEIQYWQLVTGVPVPETTDWPSVMEEGSATSTVIVGLQARAGYVFRVRAINTLGVRGRWGVQVAHINADPPPLDTPGLAAGAATEVFPGVLDPTVYTGAPFIANPQPGEYSITPSVDCEAIVTCSSSYRNDMTGITTAARAASVFYPRAYQSPAGPDAPGTSDPRWLRKPMDPSEIWESPVNVTATYQLTAGLTYRFFMHYDNFIYSSGVPTHPGSVADTRVRVELIKR